jgi:hypothetical protein
MSLAEARAIFDQKAASLSNLKCQTQSPDKLEEALYAVKGIPTFE